MMQFAQPAAKGLIKTHKTAFFGQTRFSFPRPAGAVLPPLHDEAGGHFWHRNRPMEMEGIGLVSVFKHR